MAKELKARDLSKKGRQTGVVQKDGRRCHYCKKCAKDLIGGKYLCRIHSPMREGYIGVMP